MSQSLHIVCPHCAGVNRVPDEKLRDGPRCGRCHQALFGNGPVALDDVTFDTHRDRSDIPLVVDFWAAWCGPCRMMAPAFEQAAAQVEPQVRLAKLDTEAAPETAARYGIRSIPTLIAFRGGREVARRSGALPLQALLDWIRASV